MRIASIFNGDREQIAEAIGLLHGLPGSPIMYYGDEIGMQNLPADPAEIDSRRAVRGAFDWNAADEQSKDPDSLLNTVAQIIRKD